MSSWTNCAESVHDQEQKRGLVFYGPTKVPRCRATPSLDREEPGTADRRLHHYGMPPQHRLGEATIQCSYIYRISNRDGVLSESITTTPAKMRPCCQDLSPEDHG